MRAYRQAALLMLLAVPACAQVYWTKPGFNATDWQRDNYECERDARTAAHSFSGVFDQQAFFNRCLVAHGYYQTRAVDPAEQRAVNGRTGSPEAIACTKRCWDANDGPACYAACERL